MPTLKQTTGIYGENRVLEELHRRGWATINANTIRYNMPGYDIIAHRPLREGDLTFDRALSAERKIFISVKTRGPDAGHWQIGGFRPGMKIEPLAWQPNHFTILLSQGARPGDDSFHVVPSHVVRAECAIRQAENWERKGKKGDMGSWQMHTGPRRDGQHRGGHDVIRKWAECFENWALLEKALG